MKAFLTGLILIVCAPTLAQNWEEEVCIPTFYQPGGQSVVDAAQDFAIDIVSLACGMREIVQLGEYEEMYILSYDSEKSQMKYLVYDFTAQHQTGELIAPIEKICTISYGWVPAEEPDENGIVSLASVLKFSQPSCQVTQ